MFICSIQVPAHLVPPATGIGCRGDKFETDKNKSLLTCLLFIYIYSKGISCPSLARNQIKNTRFLAFDIVHAVEFSRIGRT
jgi:hypothetical protein